MKVRLSKFKDKVPKEQKFDFESMKFGAANPNPAVRKLAFLEYFERFGELPSYLFDTMPEVDPRLLQTIDDLLKDPETSRAVRQGIETLIRRLPA